MSFAYQTEVTGDGPPLPTKWHLGCEEGRTAKCCFRWKNRRPP